MKPRRKESTKEFNISLIIADDDFARWMGDNNSSSSREKRVEVKEDS